MRGKVEASPTHLELVAEEVLVGGHLAVLLEEVFLLLREALQGEERSSQ
jgi:hypothetical protein